MTERTITLGGGCFWCIEAVYVRVRGVLDVESGYCNGHVPHPQYEQVCEGTTGHVEVVRLKYDDRVISLENILEIFFTVHDPTTLNRQGNDVGTQYRSGIYTESEDDTAQARTLIQALMQARVYAQPIVTEVEPLSMYYAAEAYHQDFYEHHPQQGYCVFVVAPKVHRLEKAFARWLKD